MNSTIRSSAMPATVEQSRIVLDCNAQWRFWREDHDGPVAVGSNGESNRNGQWWELVNLPHSVRLEPLNASGGRNFQGVCWYSKMLSIPREWGGKLVYLQFEGGMQVAEVWINGRKVKEHFCGYTPFTIDATEILKFGQDNELLVRLDNSDNREVPPGKPQGQLDFTYFGGLYRNVRLSVVDRLHIADPMLADEVAGGGVFVTYPKVTREHAIVRAVTHLQNEYPQDRQCTIRQELRDSNGALVASASEIRHIVAGAKVKAAGELDVRQPTLWHPERPHLYTLLTTVQDQGKVVDELSTRIGIRHIRFDRQAGLLINGEPFFSLGANRHQDHPYVGYALPDSQHWRDVKKLRDGGFSSFRSHYPQAPAFMDACDELGMLTIVSNPGWQFVGGELFQKRAIHNARVMVRRDRNRPSVILWEAALNESDNRPLAQALQQAIQEEFPGDQCYTAGDREGGFAAAGIGGWDVEYLHNDGSKPHWIREWGDRVDNWSDQQSSNRVARGWGESAMLVQAAAHLKRMEEAMRGSGEPADAQSSRTSGACLWAGIDCYRGYHHQPFYGGALDLFRLPKFNYFLFQSQRKQGPMVFIANFATFLSPRTVTVFSNCEKIRLLVDGREIEVAGPDRKWQVPHPPFMFELGDISRDQSTMYMTGIADGVRPSLELRAEGIIDGNVVATHVVRAPGVARKLVLEADLCGREVTADGSDWVRVYAKVCDAIGTVCPLADDLIHFDVEGEGRGAIGDGHIGANPLRAEAGIATALIGSTENAGRMVVSARAFGLSMGQIEIMTHPCRMPRLSGEARETRQPQRAGVAMSMP